MFPALSLCDYLYIGGNFDVTWVGAKSSFESKLVTKCGIRFVGINITSLRGKLLAPFILLRSIFQSIKIILKHKPDVIIGFGGYVSFATCFAGVLLRVPVVIHEQNQVMGAANRVLSYIVKRVLTGYKYDRFLYVGNPVRYSIKQLLSPKLRSRCHSASSLRILVLGGSSGARVINEIIPKVLVQCRNVMSVIHQVGSADQIAPAVEVYTRSHVSYEVVTFISDISSAYNTVDLVIGRAGASTVSELCACGLTAIFVPYPYATNDHQAHNISYLVDIGAAFMVRQESLMADALRIIQNLDCNQCSDMSNIMYEVGQSIPNTCKMIEDVLVDLADKS